MAMAKKEWGEERLVGDSVLYIPAETQISTPERKRNHDKPDRLNSQPIKTFEPRIDMTGPRTRVTPRRQTQ
jgi:hypothetical protein